MHNLSNSKFKLCRVWDHNVGLSTKYGKYIIHFFQHLIHVRIRIPATKSMVSVRRQIANHSVHVREDMSWQLITPHVMTSMNVVQEWQLVHRYVIILMVVITVAVTMDINQRTMGLTAQVGYTRQIVVKFSHLQYQEEHAQSLHGQKFPTQTLYGFYLGFQLLIASIDSL